MHCVNNAVIMQTEQLGWIEALEDELQSSKAKMIEMEQKMLEQDHVITQLVGDNLNHLQDNITGGKGWCPGPVHCKYITRKWTKY